MSTLIGESLWTLILPLAFIPLLWFIWAQGAKRCHDRGNSGLYLFIPFYFIFMLFGDSERGNNAYGANPKGQGNQDEALENH